MNVCVCEYMLLSSILLSNVARVSVGLLYVGIFI